MAETLQTEAIRLYNSAREHKRVQARHRRAAKRDMTALADLKEQAKRYGIRIILTPNGEGNNNHGQS